MQSLLANLDNDDQVIDENDDFYQSLESELSLPHLYMSSVEFCFNTQALNL